MSEPTLTDHLLELSRSLDAYRAATRKAELHAAEQIEKLWQDNAHLRDDLHAVANRLEALTRAAS